MTNSKHPIISVEGLYKTFKVAKEEIPALIDINLQIFPGEFVVILGPSGCGKSTLLNTIIGLEKPNAGHVKIHGHNIYNLDEDGKTVFRQKNFGVVHQQSNWIKSLNVLENVAFPLNAVGHKHNYSLQMAKNSLSMFAMEGYAKHKLTELSGGQQTKVAVCRALITHPPIIMADEPTGNLDSKTGEIVLDTFQRLNEEENRTIILITHERYVAEHADRIIAIHDGEIVSDEKNPRKRKINQTHKIDSLTPIQ